jgi:two-component system response regulator VicR
MSNKILIVDDDPFILFVLRFLLNREGYDVIKAEDGAECLKKVKLENPDMVLLDVMMPDVDGWEVCREIKRQFPELPVTICSVLGSEGDIEKSLKYAGANEHITKPFDFDQILDVVRSV